MSENLIKEYDSYTPKGVKAKSISLFEGFKFMKTVCVHRIVDGKEIKTIGSLWQFDCNIESQPEREILAKTMDMRFGELNAEGFGFMNAVK